ncbi:hypothetical protein KI387_002210, partial [Taxus chinensis]
TNRLNPTITQASYSCNQIQWCPRIAKYAPQSSQQHPRQRTVESGLPDGPGRGTKQ